MLIFDWSILEGIGGALMIPNIQTILRGEYEGQDLAFSHRIIGAVGAVTSEITQSFGEKCLRHRLIRA